MRTSTVIPPAAVSDISTPPVSLVSLVYIKLLFVALFWGGTFIAGRVLAQQMPPMTAASGRFAVAVVLLVLLAWKLEGGLPRLSRRQLGTTAALGLTGIFLYNLCFLAALSRMPAGRTALFVALNPIVTALASALLFRERLGWVKWLGIMLAFCGTAVVITHGDLAGLLHGGGVGAGELFMFCGISSWAAYTLIGRLALRGLSPIAATTYAAMWGLGFLLVGAAFEFSSVPWRSYGWQVWAAIGYLGVFGTVIGFVWYYEGVKALGASRTSVFNNLVPVVSIALAAAFLGEPVLASMLVGGAVTIAGVVMTNRQSK